MGLLMIIYLESQLLAPFRCTQNAIREPTPQLPSATSSTTTSSAEIPSTVPIISRVGHTLIIAILILALTETLTSKALSTLSTGSSTSLAEHSRVHLARVHTGGHHLLHLLKHFRRHSLHAWHSSSRSSWHHSRHRSHGHHHIHVIQHLLLVCGHLIGTELGPDRVLLACIKRPCEFIEAVVEVIAYIGARSAPWFVVLAQVFVNVDLRDRLSGRLIDGLRIDINLRGRYSWQICARNLRGTLRCFLLDHRSLCNHFIRGRSLRYISDLVVFRLRWRGSFRPIFSLGDDIYV